MSDEQPEKMDLRSMDIGEKNRGKLKALFPAVFTETVNDKGELVESIDFEKLKAEIGSFSDLFEARRERYGMDWPGKKDCMRLIQQPSVATLKPCREESVNFDKTENLFIEGDNLEVLKLLQKSYYGKVKMIYIDPPYNTGKEFIYPDKYSETLDTYLAYAGLADDEGKKFATNTLNEGRFHTKWLNMMYPRLYLARNLLREDGMIFISIDDNEVTNLRKVCDEIFGEENFIDTIVWKKRYGGGAKEKYLVSIHEYVLVYARNLQLIDVIEIALSEEAIKRYYSLTDKNHETRGPYRTHPLEAMKSFEERQNLVFPIPAPDGTEIWPKRQWRWGKERVNDALKNDEIEFSKGKNGDWTAHSKQYLKDGDGEIRTAKAFSIIDNIYTQHGTNEIIDIFGNAQIFPFPKPSKLIEKIIEIGTEPTDCVVMDFFAGSCALPHAVFSQNQNDGGNRKYIAVQLPEIIEENSEAFKAGYKNIADIGKERIRRVIKKIEEERAAKQKDSAGKLPGMEEEQKDLDLGFKVLKLDRSNFKVWDGTDPNASEEQIAKQLDLFVEHINPKSSQEDILYELLLKSGFMPTEKIEKLTLAGKTVFSIAEGALLICLEEEITRDLIDAVAGAEPMRFICLDKGFKGNDQLKANAVQTFAARNQGREKAEQIVFRTV